jgi:hypothetical protein
MNYKSGTQVQLLLDHYEKRDFGLTGEIVEIDGGEVGCKRV